MRVAMITLNTYDSYGNVLQKYALYRTLQKYADEVDTLWQHTTVPFLPYRLELNKDEEGNRKRTAFVAVRQSKIKDFCDTHIQTRFDIPYLEDLADEYDFFVIGSDQVWNPEFAVPGRFLDFAPPEKRIAYAASITISELPEEVQETYRKKILEMPHVSIREKEGCDIVEKLTGKRPLHVLDPTFLLTADEWRKIEKRPAWLNKKIYDNGYLLTYFFSGKPSKQVYELAKKFNLPMINLFDMDNFNHYVSGIEEYLYLFDHATFVCTHSFHGLAFACIFRRPFILYRVGKMRTLRFSRAGSLLELFGLSDRVTDMDLNIDLQDPLKIDFNRCEEVLPVERKKAFKFLSNALWQ